MDCKEKLEDARKLCNLRIRLFDKEIDSRKTEITEELNLLIKRVNDGKDILYGHSLHRITNLASELNELNSRKSDMNEMLNAISDEN